MLAVTSCKYSKHQEVNSTPDLETLFQGSVEQERAISSTSTGTTDADYSYSQDQTSTQSIDWNMFLLEKAAQQDNRDEFIRLIQSIDWLVRDAGDYVQAIKLSLQIGAHLTARQLAHKAKKRFPTNKLVAKYAHILAPSQVINEYVSPNTEVQNNAAWFKENRSTYLGRWVAIKNGKLLAVGDSYQQVREQVGTLKKSGILILKVS